MNNTSHEYYYLLLSIMAGFLLTLIILFDSISASSPKPFIEKLYLFSGFLAACIFGLSCAWFPNWYRNIFRKKNLQTMNSSLNKIKKNRKGHHPDCKNFHDHIITINHNVYCTGCFGLSIGFILAIILTAIYMILPLILPTFLLIISYILSLLIIGYVYIETVLNRNKKWIHIATNALLILGLNLLIITIYELTSEIQYGFIALLFAFLFIETRIQLSKQKHKLICAECENICKMY